MAEEIFRNVPREKPAAAIDLVDFQEGQVVSRSLVQNTAVSITMFAFDHGEGLSAHTTPGEAMALVLDGAAEITVGDETTRVSSGEIRVLPANIPHAVHAPTRMKMLLTLVKKSD
ncbi:MAG: cupin domain-containing protein [Desulfovibrionaceae bacterium]